MLQPELLARLIRALESLAAPYAIVGSVASSLWGEPRATHDIDVVVILRAEHVGPLVESFPEPDFYLDEVAASEAIERSDQFNLLDIDEGTKIDFWIAHEEFDRVQIERARDVDIGGYRARFASPEDTILAKLRWAKMSGGSEKQLHDALAVFRVRRPELDLAYIDRWASELEVDALWAELRVRARAV